MLRNIKAHLGPRDVIVNGKVISTVDDIVLHINQCTRAQLKEWSDTPTILLVKPLVIIGKRGRSKN